jgi:hypothetical protein
MDVSLNTVLHGFLLGLGFWIAQWIVDAIRSLLFTPRRPTR